MEFTQEQKPLGDNVQAEINSIDVELNEDQLEAVSGGSINMGMLGEFLYELKKEEEKRENMIRLPESPY